MCCGRMHYPDSNPHFRLERAEWLKHAVVLTLRLVILNPDCNNVTIGMKNLDPGLRFFGRPEKSGLPQNDRRGDAGMGIGSPP